MTKPDEAQAPLRATLRRRRRALGLTQDDMARMLRINRIKYCRIETGERRIRFLEIAVICEALGCGVNELIEDEQLAAAYAHAAKAILGKAGRADYEPLVKPVDRPFERG